MNLKKYEFDKLKDKHNKLTVQPYLDYHLIQSDSILTVEFSNQGFGPAIIKSMTYSYNNKIYNSLEDFLKNSGEIRNRLGSFQYGKNTVVASGERKLILKLKNRNLRGVTVNISYESLYEDSKEFSFKF